MVSTFDSALRRELDIEVAGGIKSHIAYIDVGHPKAQPVVFLHGNPTSSFLWRNIIPIVQGANFRCLAPDLVGQGNSGKAASTEDYKFTDHASYLDQWFLAMGFTAANPVTLVIHDWGSGLGFHWAHRHRELVHGIVYMEAIVAPIPTWEDFPEAARRIFQGFRSESGEEMCLKKNIFVERVLPGSILRKLTDDEMAMYRQPFLEEGEVRRPTLTWPRQIPIVEDPHTGTNGEAVIEIAEAYAQWMEQDSSLPKLFINAEPGSILIGKVRDRARAFPNQEEITVKGSHFIQEDSPSEIGQGIVDFLEKNPIKKAAL